MDTTMPVRAGFWQRGLGLLIDTVLLAPVLFLLGYTLGQAYLSTFPNGRDETIGLMGSAAGLLMVWLYSAWMESSKRGATLGKQVMGMRVVRADGAPLSFARAGARAAGKLLSGALVMIDFLLAAGQQRRALHDRLADTLVVRG